MKRIATAPPRAELGFVDDREHYPTAARSDGVSAASRKDGAT